MERSGHLDRATDGGGARFPLSFAQERLWLFGQVAATSFNLPTAVHLDGALNVAALEQAARHIVGRHAILRTRFTVHDGTPAQEVLPAVHLDLRLVDLQPVPADARAAVARDEIAREMARPFDLARPPLFRPYILRLGARHHVLLFTLNHLVVDEWSLDLLTREIVRVYADYAAGRPPCLKELKAQYSDVVQRERQELSGSTLERHLDFWKTYLAELPAVLELPSDHPRPSRRGYEGAWISRPLAGPMAARVRELARSEGATSFHVLLAAFNVLLARYTGSVDIAVGTPVMNRSNSASEDLIGPFLNTLVVRTDCSGNPTFREVLRRTRQSALAALAHARVPFEILVDALQPERDASYNPLIQVWFVYHRPSGSARLPGLDVDFVELHAAATPFDFVLSMGETGSGFICACQYNTSLFRRGTIERLFTHWERLLGSLTTRPDVRVRDHALMSPEEIGEQIGGWNRTAVEWGRSACVHDAIDAVAARHPDAVAVAAADRQLTYGALRTASDRLAARLRRAGVALESRVAVLMDRSPDLVVALLGIMKAGGAYVPLDPAEPPERTSRILADARVISVVTSAALRSRVPPGIEPVIVDEAEPPGVGAPSTPRVSGRNLCYVLYTSGTTGEPKGVAVEHASLTNVLRSMSRAPGCDAADALLAVTPMTFDIAGLEIFLPLIDGGRLALAPEGAAADGEGLAARLAMEDASILQATPGTWRLLLDAGWRAPDRFRVLCGGEPLPRELARDLIAAAGHVWNCYGPTETTIWSTLQHLTSPEEAVSIGRPIANTSVYLLDASFAPVPVGVPARLYIGGAGLARGYWGRPAETAASYLPNPFAAEGARLYATGDEARFLPDGRIDCRGRSDQQVKLRGLRIELNAIANVLEAHPLVHASVAIVCEDARRGRFLAAYVTGPQIDELRHADLRGHVASRLPSYMVPPAIVPLAALPRTRHGKIDRRALPPPEESHFRGAREPVPPRTPFEHAVAGAWREVLGMSVVGVEDDFFELGGDSLQAMRVILRIREALGAHLSARTFFDGPTIAALAARAAEALRTADASPGAPIVTPVAERDMILAPQQENWWRQEHMTGNVQPNNVQYGLRFAGAVQPIALEQGIAALQRRHDALRTGFVPVGDDSAVPAVSDPAMSGFRLATVDLSGLPPAQRDAALERIWRLDNRRVFDLTRGSLCRATLLRLGPDDNVVLMTTHHLVCDEWSIDVLVSDLSRLCTSCIGGSPALLPPVPFRYVDFAHWQRDWLAGTEAAAQLAYWKRQLSPPLGELFADVPGAALEIETPYFAVRRRASFAIPPDAVDIARRLARSEGCTLFAAVLAALKVALFAQTGQPDVRVGTLTANRSLPGAEQVVGLFTNAVCLRTHVDRSQTARELVRAVQAAVRDATAHQDFPFEHMARALHAEHGTLRSSLFQVMVIWQAMPAATLHFPAAPARLYRPADTDTEVLVRSSLELRVDLEETSTAINGSVTYKGSRYTATQIAGLAGNIARCLTLVERNRALSVAALCDALEPHDVAPGDVHHATFEAS